jgi:DNA-binding transcriptional LysR family regulator
MNMAGATVMVEASGQGPHFNSLALRDKPASGKQIVSFFETKATVLDKMQEMASFVAVVDAGSFVGAAESTDLSKAAISRHVSDLEQRLGVRLLHRTTRRLSLTAEGQAFHARCKELLAAVDEAESEITSQLGQPSGLLRVNAPLTFGVLHLAPLWGRFADIHPKVSLDVTLGDRQVDLVDEGYDLVIRITHRSISRSTVRRCTRATSPRTARSPTLIGTHGTSGNSSVPGAMSRSA